ncbi:hypothetical protein FZEAL_2221 [Fusarium zealandicum]|uniref:Short-chain dehydrogenase n=1 Tax=Fusarium zealandicum TaxID=1053134 RepID=A0A8H4URW6_9HYPO|nr:hypothetical protein FZEAL_2221 [Fusarium zealandicum]
MADRELVLITGANTGIGFETAKALFRSGRPYHVLLGSRAPANADKAIAELKEEYPDTKSTVEPIQIDIINDQSINKTFEYVNSNSGKLDVLVSNAGSFDKTFGHDTADFRTLFNKTYDVNVSAYRSSKVALNMVMLSWHHLLKPDGVRVWSISPGFLAMGLENMPEVLKKAGAGDPSTGAELVKRR